MSTSLGSLDVLAHGEAGGKSDSKDTSNATHLALRRHTLSKLVKEPQILGAIEVIAVQPIGFEPANGKAGSKRSGRNLP